MARLARHGSVLFHERISCLTMIELLEWRLPMNERKILAIVLEVAPHTVPAIGILHPEQRVVTLMRGQTVRNFLMAFETFERRRAGSELVTGVALSRTVEGLVRFGERSGRNLGAGAGSGEEESAEREQSAEEPRCADGPDTVALYFCRRKLHQIPPTNHSWRAHGCQLDSNLARAMIRQTLEPSSCFFTAKLAKRTGEGEVLILLVYRDEVRR
jgi:hypothetical protein